MASIDTGVEICYTYDDKGNILSKTTGAETKEYKYQIDSDKLMKFGLETFEYDALGNPTTYSK